MRLYKVKHISTGLFWEGGDLPYYTPARISEKDALEEKFNSNGKSWVKIHYLETALRNVIRGTLQKILMDECEIIEYRAEPTYSVLPLQIDKIKERIKHEIY